MEDMSNLISEFSKMIEKNGVPDNLKDIINNINSDNKNNTSNNSNNDVSSFDLNNIDIQTFLKLKSALDKMNSKNNPNTKLLLALKPYLKENKKYLAKQEFIKADEVNQGYIPAVVKLKEIINWLYNLYYGVK